MAALATGRTNAHTSWIRKATKSRTYGSATCVALSFPVNCKLSAMQTSAAKTQAGNAAALLVAEVVAAPVMIHATAVSVAAIGKTLAISFVMCMER